MLAPVPSESLGRDSEDVDADLQESHVSRRSRTGGSARSSLARQITSSCEMAFGIAGNALKAASTTYVTHPERANWSRLVALAVARSIAPSPVLSSTRRILPPVGTRRW